MSKYFIFEKFCGSFQFFYIRFWIGSNTILFIKNIDCKLFEIYLRHAADMKRVTFWGVLDSESWKNNWPVEGRVDYPLAFYGDGKEKPFVEHIMRMADPNILPAKAPAKKTKKKK